eukprot:695703-Prymnesium_polylepis.1
MPVRLLRTVVDAARNTHTHVPEKKRTYTNRTPSAPTCTYGGIQRGDVEVVYCRALKSCIV